MITVQLPAVAALTTQVTRTSSLQFSNRAALAASVPAAATLSLAMRQWNDGAAAALAAPGGAAMIGLDIPGSGTLTVQDRLRARAKSPIADWADLQVLWLGTSIPAEGEGIDSYPDLFCASMGCSLTSNAFAGSHAYYDVAGASDDLSTIKALSMTDDDRVVGLALYGAASVYDDSFDTVTVASQMTCDYRIKAAFADTPFGVVVLDHAHNDKEAAAGTLDPASVAITGVTKGATTTIQTATPPAVGAAVGLRVTGITGLDYFAGRVQAADAGSFTVNLDTSAYAGAFASGSFSVFDRATVYGGFQFLIYYIKWAAALVGADPVIILAGAPSEYTINGTFQQEIRDIAASLRAVAAKWDLAFFDVAAAHDVKAGEQLTWFGDYYHPITRATRQALANHWTAWASGGQHPLPAPGAYLPGVATSFTDQRAAEYSEFKGGFVTPDYAVGAPATVLDEDFSGGTGAWTAVGTAPAAGAAPWDAGESAVLCHSQVGATTSYLHKLLTFDEGFGAEFDLWLPAVTGLTSGGTKTVAIAQFRTAAGQNYYALELLVKETTVVPRIAYFQTPNVDLVHVANSGLELQAATQHHIRWEAIQAASGRIGGLLFYVDDVLVTPLGVEILDIGQAAPGRFDFGIRSCNTGDDFDIYLGNLVLTKNAIADYSARFTGSFTTADARTVTVVNGVITACA